MRLALFTVLLLTGCAAHKPNRLHLKPLVTIEFRGIKDGKCRIGDVQYNAQTGNQVVQCVAQEQTK